MATDFYTKSGNPATSSAGASAAIRNEFSLIEAGFAKLLGLSANAGKIWRVNAGGNAVEAATETGTGAVVLATSPTLVTPALGTPSSGVLTNCTGLPVGGIAGLAAGVATFLATPTSANLAAAVTNETGSGALVFATSPTLVTPALGVATVTTINGLGITTTTGVLTVANGKTLTASHTLTLAGTDGTTMTFPSTTATIARTDSAQTFTGVQTFSSAITVPAGGVTFPSNSSIQQNSTNLWLVNTGGVAALYIADTVNNDRAIKIEYTPGVTGAVGGALIIGQTSRNDANFTHGYTAFYTNGTEKLRITSDGRLYGTALHNNAGAITGVTNQYVASGTYVPTITNGTNVASSASPTGRWIRTGNVVVVSIKVVVDPTAAASTTTFDVSLPIASNLAASDSLNGFGGSTTVAPGIFGTITGNAANDRAVVLFDCDTDDQITFYGTFIYEVLA